MLTIWHDFLYQPVFNFLIWVYNNWTDQNLGWAVVYMTIILRLILLPFSIISEKNKNKNLEIREKHLTIVKSEKYRKNMSDVTSGEKNGMYGKKHSTETIDKIRKKAKEWWEKKREDERRNNIESDLG